MNRLLAFSGISVLIVGFVLLTAPISRIPLLDAKRQVLAETARAGYCAGEVGIKTRWAGDVGAMRECLSTSTLPDEIDHAVVQPAFCEGVAANYPVTPDECVSIVERDRMWPTMSGSYSTRWNDRFKYPLDSFGISAQSASESRTGDRADNQREGFDRGQ